MFFNDTPNTRVIHGIIAVNDSVTKGDDARQFGNLRRDARVLITQSVQGFANDLEFTLNGPPELPVGKVFLIGPPRAPVPDGATRVEHVKQEFDGSCRS